MTKNKVGHPTETIEEKLAKHILDVNKVSKLYKAGWTDKQVADFIGVTKMAIMKWKKIKKFCLPLKDWKVLADTRVERSLYERAKGYQCKEDKIFCERGKVTIVPTIHHYPPDPTSMIFWLKNRQPDKWREQKDSMPKEWIDEEIELIPSNGGLKPEIKDRISQFINN